tara:strand:- start:289 stop:936 length:648 start_codon:yes stop_codon:yes gene_type:complete
MGVIAFLFFNPLIAFFASPFEQIHSQLSANLYVTSLFEGFLTKFKFSLLMGAILATPLLLFHLLRFVLPGLHAKERRLLILAIISGLFLSSAAFYMVYFKLLPFSIQFLTSHQFIPHDIGILLNYHESIFYVFNLIIYTILLFQFPIILALLLYMNMIQTQTLLSMSRYVVIGILVLSAIVTPPDLVTQLGLAGPLIALYFSTIGLAKVFNWGCK